MAQKSLDPKSRSRKRGPGRQVDGQRPEGAQRPRTIDNAGNEQKNALDPCARALMRWPSSNPGKMARARTARRIPWAAAIPGPGSGVKLPGTSDLARARGILQELRKRAGERGRPRLLVQHHRHLHAGGAGRLDQGDRLGDGAAGVQHAVDHQHMTSRNLFRRPGNHGDGAGHALVAIGPQPRSFPHPRRCPPGQGPEQIGGKDKAAHQDRHGDVGHQGCARNGPRHQAYPFLDLVGGE